PVPQAGRGLLHVRGHRRSAVAGRLPHVGRTRGCAAAGRACRGHAGRSVRRAGLHPHLVRDLDGPAAGRLAANPRVREGPGPSAGGRLSAKPAGDIYWGRMNKVVAVIGASNDRRKFGNRAVRAYLEQGYTVVPINPHETQVEGLKAYASILDVPGPVDM